MHPPTVSPSHAEYSVHVALPASPVARHTVDCDPHAPHFFATILSGSVQGVPGVGGGGPASGVASFPASFFGGGGGVESSPGLLGGSGCAESSPAGWVPDVSPIDPSLPLAE